MSIYDFGPPPGDPELKYRQCKLEKGSKMLVTWIPEPYAVVGEYLKLRNDEYEWVDGWKVVEVTGEAVERTVFTLMRQHAHYVLIVTGKQVTSIFEPFSSLH